MKRHLIAAALIVSSPLCPAVETFYIIFGNTMKGAPS